MSERGQSSNVVWQATELTREQRWQMLGGDRFYTLARWAVLALIFLAFQVVATRSPAEFR